ncbi:DUF975 family protein [Halobacillus litoralis]|uniref:DUF975 family protein n=1 Tax=Halobacillus litoralis TaxID=45668 RepID=UPI001CFCE2AC|nr:DUF975 family protein [Halobacillus litoralis]
MIGSTLKDAVNILNGNWLKIIGMVVFTYFIKLVLETLPVQGTVSIQMTPMTVASSETILSLLVASAVNSVLFFVLVDYITQTQYTMRKRFVRACTYPFRNWQLLYKGLIVFFLSNFLIFLIGMMLIYGGIGSLFTYAAGISIATSLLVIAYLLLFTLLIWLFLGISQSMYILYDDPDVGVFKSLKDSFSLMKGHKWALLALFVLTGLALIIGVLLVVIGAILSLVLYEVARFAFYRELKRKKRLLDWQEKVNG